MSSDHDDGRPGPARSPAHADWAVGPVTRQDLPLGGQTTCEFPVPPVGPGAATPAAAPAAVDELGETLVAGKLIDRFQLFKALNHSYHHGCSLGEALVALGYLDAASLERISAEIEG